MELVFTKRCGKIEISKTTMKKGRKRETLAVELDRIELPAEHENLSMNDLYRLYDDKIKAHAQREFGK